MVPSQEQPTHVVGSQGRRGILPSAPGRAAAAAGGSGPGKALIPEKDADGKFPCPHCNKTYLHAKHLKRHLLRHTGDRPYMCHLCKDTFSRSDILKRHFQKCSLRRGNPTGANHLAHQPSSKRNSTGSNRLSIGNADQLNLSDPVDGQGTGYTNGSLSNPLASIAGMSTGPPAFPNGVAPFSNRSSRANSLNIRPGSVGNDTRNSLASLNLMSSSRHSYDAASDNRTPVTLSSNAGQGVPTYAMPVGLPSSMLSQSYNFNPPVSGSGPPGIKTEETGTLYNRQSLPYNDGVQNGQSSDLDWSHMFQPGGQDGFMFQPNPPQSQTPMKTEAGIGSNNFPTTSDTTQDSLFNGLYANPASYGGDHVDHLLPGFPNWNLDTVQNDPLQSKADALLAFCFSNPDYRTSNAPAAENMRNCLTVENIKHFVAEFTNFQGHWPLIHMPTFNLLEANNGLVLAIICIGAVYSDKLNVPQVRQMMELVKTAVQSSSRVYALVNAAPSGQTNPIGQSASDVEEMQALIMIQLMFTWHGNTSHRAQARQEFATLVRIARQVNLLHVLPPGSPGYSTLHQPGSLREELDLSVWDWNAWVEQEKRARAMFMLFLSDAALVIYFNCPPQFDFHEIRLPLPADDAAWDAKTATDCADALGLRGPSAQEKNITGSRRPKQPDLRSALRSLFDPHFSFQPRATNVYSKFILIHALHVQLWKISRYASQGNSVPNFNGFLPSGPSTPLSQNDWVVQNGSGGTASTANSGCATPIDGTPIANNPQAQHAINVVHQAFIKWKLAWDIDMKLQYPPEASVFRRFGFSRDGVHFYFLGLALLQNHSRRPSDWQIPPDNRFQQVMEMLKRIKDPAARDQQQQRQDIGSVGDIDDTYGVRDLTLDMKLLFKPIDQQIDSPISGVQTGMI
ncbi:hypothetical protein B0A49_00519 [Cryomyces minteri]|uniref:C2H2-type domain-containing protein n=2 Tax=Cryomyces minteri TaxID=331657 RepID=A0A4U0Y0U9_9PEZI|nr:hypothetical protein B0A49_00519 [Cryomyces minteri]